MIGCHDSKPEQPASPSAPSSPPQTGNIPPPPPLPVANTALPAQPPAPTTPNTTQRKAVVGVGAKGHYDIEGPIFTPIASYFAVRERLAYEVQIPQALQLFRAAEDRLPKSHEEFMQRIVKENNIRLPELPEGCRYIFDPKRGELMVESPAPQQ